MTREFYYQIKGRSGESLYGSFGNWSFPPIFSGRVTAENKKEAKLLIEEEYSNTFPLRVLRKDLESNEFLMSITDMTDNDHLKRLFDERQCQECENKFRRIDLYNDANTHYKGETFCSDNCHTIDKERKRIENFTQNADFNSTIPVIYKITHIPTGKSYIGQTNQSFTLRWWQHIKWGKTDCKFQQALKDSDITDWTFGVIHVCEKFEELDKWESHYIREHDSINNGYNTVKVGDCNPDKAQKTIEEVDEHESH